MSGRLRNRIARLEENQVPTGLPIRLGMAMPLPRSESFEQWQEVRGALSEPHPDVREMNLHRLQARYGIPPGGHIVGTLHHGHVVIDADRRVVGRWNGEQQRVELDEGDETQYRS